MSRCFQMLLIALLSAVIPRLSNASTSCLMGDLNSAGIRGLVKTIRNPDCNIRKIDDVLAILPEGMRSSFALMYRSQSLQGPHKVDYQNPRVILTNAATEQTPEKQIFLSFNGKPSLAGYANLEVLEIDLSRKPEDVFRYFDIQFPDETVTQTQSWDEIQKQIQTSHANPAHCVACHGTPAKPIFKTYPQWDGSYASTDARDDKNEVRQIQIFRKNTLADRNSRYRHLIWRYDDEALKGYSELQKGQMLNGNSNPAGFNLMLAEANHQRIAKAIKNDPLYRQFRPAILAASMKCADFEGFIPAKVRSQLDQNVMQSFDLQAKYPVSEQNAIVRKFESYGEYQFGDGWLAIRERPWRSWPAMHLLWFDTLSNQGRDRSDKGVTAIRYLFEGRGQDISSWFIDIKKNSYSMSDGRIWSAQLAFSMIQTDPELKDIAYQLQGSYEMDVSPYQRNFSKVCEQLKASSVKLLEDVDVPILKKSSSSVVDSGLKIPKVFQTSCATCHSQAKIAPVIPFANPSQLNTWLSRPENKEMILYRLNTTDGFERMPLNRNLSKDELAELMAYIQGL